MPTNPPKFTTHSWEQLVRQADGPDYQKEKDFPEVYYFHNRKPKRDTGQNGGPYKQP